MTARKAGRLAGISAIEAMSPGEDAQIKTPKFTGWPYRDGETALDYTPACYYSGVQGRFQSPDRGMRGSTRQIRRRGMAMRTSTTTLTPIRVGCSSPRLLGP